MVGVCVLDHRGRCIWTVFEMCQLWDWWQLCGCCQRLLSAAAVGVVQRLRTPDIAQVSHGV